MIRLPSLKKCNEALGDKGKTQDKPAADGDQNRSDVDDDDDSEDDGYEDDGDDDGAAAAVDDDADNDDGDSDDDDDDDADDNDDGDDDDDAEDDDDDDGDDDDDSEDDGSCVSYSSDAVADDAYSDDNSSSSNNLTRKKPLTHQRNARVAMTAPCTSATSSRRLSPGTCVEVGNVEQAAHYAPCLSCLRVLYVIFGDYTLQVVSGKYSSRCGVIKNANSIGWYDVTLGSSGKIFKIRSSQMRPIASDCKSPPNLRSITTRRRVRRSSCAAKAVTCGDKTHSNSPPCPSRSFASATNQPQHTVCVTNQPQHTVCVIDGRGLALFDEIDCRDKDDIWYGVFFMQLKFCCKCVF